MAMALSPDGSGFDLEAGPFQQGDSDMFNEICYWDHEPPAYAQAPSTFDGRSTTAGSEVDVPPLTLGPTLTPSTRSKASPSLGPPEDPVLHHGLGPSMLSDGEAALALSPLDKSSLFRHMGGNPEIQVQESLASPPKRLCLDDISLGLSPRSPSLHSLQAGSPSQPTASPMRRGRSNPLPTDKREKASEVRKAKACSWCHTHKISCDKGVPCGHCRQRFPAYPGVCDRATLIEIRFPDHYRQTSIWLHNPSGAVLYKIDSQSAGDQGETALTLDQPLEAFSGSSLALQMYVPLISQGYHAPPPFATFGSVPMSTAGNWPGTFSYHEPRLSPDELLIRAAERQATIEFDKRKGESFCAALWALLLACRASPSAVVEPRSANGRKKQASIVNAKDLVCRVIKMQCWLRVWSRPALYCWIRQSATSVTELRVTATRALIACEKEVLSELDELPPRLARESQGTVWACLWQMILTYRGLIKMYSGVGHGPSSSTNLGFVTGLGEAPATAERLYRRLVAKYVAYFSSRSSPVFPKHEGPRTCVLLPGDQQLQLEWENVLLQRKEFYRTVSEEVPSDAFLKTLIIDMEVKLERKRPI